MKACALLLVAVPLAAQVVPSDATLEFDNPLVRVIRVHYRPHQKTAMHQHPATSSG